MKEISTKIVINASIDKVWSVFTNFKDYSKWNPFIISIEGQVVLGKRIKTIISPPDSKKMVFKPRILFYKEKKELQWLGHFIFPGLFDGRHVFSFTENGDDSVTFIQKEMFKGILVPLFSKMIDINTKNGFVLMNEKIKEICENN